MAPKTAAPVHGTAAVRAIDERLIIPLPEEASEALPSRGQVAACAVLNGQELVLVVEPDGLGGHWLRADDAETESLGLTEGSPVEFTLTPAATWPEPEIPSDLGAALEDADDLAETWASITPMARWEWVRWIGSTRSPDTRARRVEVSIDKMRHGKRRPCCFNLAACTDPELARGGRLKG